MAVAAMATAHGCQRVWVHIDDFKGTESSTEAAAQAVGTVAYLLADCGLQDAPKKRQLGRCVLYCGVQGDTDADGDGSGRMEASISAEKLQRAQLLASALAQRRSLSKGDLDRAIGVLGSLAALVLGAPTNLRRLINEQARISRDQERRGVAMGARARERLTLSTPMQLDFAWWAKAAAACNGRSTILQRPQQSPGYLFTDASDVGFGGFLITDLAAGTFSTFSYAWHDRNLLLRELDATSRAILSKPHLWPQAPAADEPASSERAAQWLVCRRELFALLVAQLLWRDHFRGRVQAPYNDNQVAVACVRRMTTKHVPNMQIVRAIAEANVAGNTRCDNILWVDTHSNYVADAASRLRPPAEVAALARQHVRDAQAQAAAGVLPQAWHPLQFPHQGLAIHRFADAPAPRASLPQGFRRGDAQASGSAGADATPAG